MWGRYDVLDLFIKNNSKYADILVIGSEGSKSKEFCEDRGCFYKECPNDPLDNKLNERIQWFLSRPEYTHIIFLGSDNLISGEVYDSIVNNSYKYDIISWKDIFFYDLESKRIFYRNGYTNHRMGEPLAPGRCMSKKFIKNNKQLWDNNINRSPDYNIWTKIKDIQSQIVLSCKDIEGIILDIKTDENINSFDKISKINPKGNIYTKADVDKINKMI